MSGPTFSPDGNWMWNGTEWIPAPPKSNVLPQSSIDEKEVSSVANQSGVDPNLLAQSAPYFDENQDGVLQQSELQQAAMSLSQEPTTPSPASPVVPEQPVVQQPVAPVMPQQPVAPVMPQQPVMQEHIIQSPSSGRKGKMIAAISLAMVLLLAGVFYVWADNANLLEDEVDFGPEYRFESDDNWDEITTETGDGLVTVQNNGDSIEYTKIVVILQVDNGSEVQCDHHNSALSTWCIYDYSMDEDSVWNPGEAIYISEGDENLCDGANNWSDERLLLYCDVKVSIYERSEDSENKLLHQTSVEAV